MNALEITRETAQVYLRAPRYGEDLIAGGGLGECHCFCRERSDTCKGGGSRAWIFIAKAGFLSFEGTSADTCFSVQASLDTALGVALVPYFSPKHHPRATRILNGVIKAQPDNSEARFARAQVFQASGSWAEARKNFQILLDNGGDDKEMVAAKEEVGWCLVNEGKLADGRDVLEEVVEMRDARWEQEGKDDEAMPRARAWWRLGRTEWMIGGKQEKSIRKSS